MAVKKSGQLVLFRFPQNRLASRQIPSGSFTRALTFGSPRLACVHDLNANSQAVPGIDEVINATEVDCAQSGLKTASVIRLTRLAVVSDSIFTGSIGQISAARLGGLKKRLAQWIESS